ncbi:amidohydrolase family protein [Sneathia vaginalis]|uniref:amidohydrolase family protein n=1 Tax=Sneathia vaginalis TaxID=187101 RepID=UPI0035C715F6
MSILIKNISYLDIENEKIVDNIDILIEDNVFKKIGTNLNICADKIIDGNNMLATPGFINSHTHLGMSYFRNYADDLSLMDWLQTKIWPIEDKLNDDDIYWSSILSLIENIKSGVTTVCDMYCSMEKVADATILLGIRGVLTRGLTDFDGKGKQKLLELDELYNKYNNAGNGRIKIVPGPSCNIYL